MTRPSALHTRRTPVAVALGALLLLAGCDGNGDDADATTQAPPTAAERLEQAHEVLVDAGTVHLSMVGEELPEGMDSYIISADGDGTMDPPAFDGTITAALAGVQADVPTVAVDDELWVKLPYVPRHVQTDPADLNVPDPAALFDPETGLVGLLDQTKDPEFADRSRTGAEVVQEVVGTLPGQAVADLLLIGDAGADFDVAYALVEDSWQLRTVTINGPFYPSVTSTYTVTLTAYGEPVTVTKP